MIVPPVRFPPCARTSQHGFTLVELSIVIAIFGLIVGGILGGQAMIRAGQMRSVLEQHSLYLKAVNAFQDKYDYLPGDMPNAVDYWGLAGGTDGRDPDCSLVASSTTATCDGNGNGIVEDSASGPEYTRFWQHLNSAGLIEGRFTGAYDAAGGLTKLNAPSGKLPNSLWGVYHHGIITSSTQRFNGEYGNTFMFGGFTSDKYDYPNVGVMTADDIWALDSKIDDARPGTGKFVVNVNGSFANCTDGANSAATSANYVLGTSTKLCTIIFRDQF